MQESVEFLTRAINTIRFLSVDAVQKANSGHPGLPMGAAALTYTLWMRHLKFNPANPKWANRDRFILSGGHGSMLLYSMLHLTGYKVSLDDLKNFRQWGSITPGHPEYGMTPGVEVTTGPLGQGFANGVGMAIAAKHLAAKYNRPNYDIVDNFIFAIVTDGDLMEGVASEAASLAGHLKLGNLIYLYDNNHISIEGNTRITFTENVKKRFNAYGWHTAVVEDGNNVEEVDKAIRSAKLDQRPSLILCHTIIGYGLPTRQNTAKAHGEPPGEEEVNHAKENLGWPLSPKFLVQDDILAHFRKAMEKGRLAEENWQEIFFKYQSEFPKLASELVRVWNQELPENWCSELPEYFPSAKGMATRNASGEVLNALAKNLPEIIGGSADLAGSTKTWLNGDTAFQADNYLGRNMHFGVREHAMGAIVNGMASYGGVKPYGGTFLVFSDYMRPAIRLSALSHYPSIWVFTHDSIGLGEDGPTHQPIEHLAALRAIPNLLDIRPADANEVREAWKIAIQKTDGPTCLILTRQNVQTLDRAKFSSASGLEKGAYVLADLGNGNPDVILMASGSEVGLIVEAGYKLEALGVCVRLVSFPSWNLFENQNLDYQNSVFPIGITARIAVEAGSPFGWERWIGNGIILGIDHFGASAPQEILFEKYGLHVNRIVGEVQNLLHHLDTGQK